MSQLYFFDCVITRCCRCKLLYYLIHTLRVFIAKRHPHLIVANDANSITLQNLKQFAIVCNNLFHNPDLTVMSRAEIILKN